MKGAALANWAVDCGGDANEALGAPAAKPHRSGRNTAKKRKGHDEPVDGVVTGRFCSLKRAVCDLCVVCRGLSKVRLSL